MHAKSHGRKPLSYTNRFGRTFFVHRVRSSGRTRFVTSCERVGALITLPSGFEILENINGRVSVRAIRARQITEAEESLTRSTLDQMRPNAYQAVVRDRAITVYASALDRKTYDKTLDAEFADGFAVALEETLSRKYGRELADLFRMRRQERDDATKPLRFYPLLQFELADRSSRTFTVKRIYFTGDQDWLALETLSLSAALMRYIPHLGRDSFFDLL